MEIYPICKLGNDVTLISEYEEKNLQWGTFIFEDLVLTGDLPASHQSEVMSSSHMQCSDVCAVKVKK